VDVDFNVTIELTAALDSTRSYSVKGSDGSDRFVIEAANSEMSFTVTDNNTYLQDVTSEIIVPMASPIHHFSKGAIVGIVIGSMAFVGIVVVIVVSTVHWRMKHQSLKQIYDSLDGNKDGNTGYYF
jgi:hypothetical protein